MVPPLFSCALCVVYSFLGSFSSAWTLLLKHNAVEDSIQAGRVMIRIAVIPGISGGFSFWERRRLDTDVRRKFPRALCGKGVAIVLGVFALVAQSIGHHVVRSG